MSDDNELITTLVALLLAEATRVVGDGPAQIPELLDIDDGVIVPNYQATVADVLESLTRMAFRIVRISQGDIPVGGLWITDRPESFRALNELGAAVAGHDPRRLALDVLHELNGGRP